MDTLIAFKVAIVSFGKAQIDIECLVNHGAQIDGLFEANNGRVFLADVGQQFAKNLLLNLTTNFFRSQIGFILHASTHSRVELVHGLREGTVLVAILKEASSRIIQRVPEKVFEFTARIEAENTKDCEDGRALGQEGNVDTKGGRTPGRGNTLVHLESTRRAKLFVAPE